MTDNDITVRGYVERGDGPRSAQVDDADALARLLDRIDAEARAWAHS